MSQFVDNCPNGLNAVQCQDKSSHS